MTDEDRRHEAEMLAILLETMPPAAELKSGAALSMIADHEERIEQIRSAPRCSALVAGQQCDAPGVRHLATRVHVDGVSVESSEGWLCAKHFAMLRG